MKTNLCALNGAAGELDHLLKEVEKCAAYNNLSDENTIKLRLLAEELVCTLPVLLKDCSGNFWAENEGSCYRLVVKVRADSSVSYDVRKKALQLASDGKNEAYRGIMGKIRMAAETLLYPSEFSPSYNEEAESLTPYYEAWSLSAYKESIQNELDEARRLAAWDELEMSIIAKLATNVTVSVYNKDVTITVIKNF